MQPFHQNAGVPSKTPRPAMKPDSSVSKSLNFGSKENPFQQLSRPLDIQPPSSCAICSKTLGGKFYFRPLMQGKYL